MSNSSLLSPISQGDIFYGSNVNNIVKLPIGSEGSILKVVNGLPSWSAANLSPRPLVQLPSEQYNGTKVTGRGFAVLTDSGNNVKVWGYSTCGFNGLATSGSTLPQNLSFATPPQLPLTQLAITMETGYVLDSAGQVFAWGCNNTGQLGQSDTTNRNIATKISAFSATKITKIFVATDVTDPGVNDSFAFFLDVQGNIYGVGSNASGQIGNGTQTNVTVPVKVSLPLSVTNLWLNGNQKGSVFTQLSDGSVYCWGNNDTSTGTVLGFPALPIIVMTPTLQPDLNAVQSIFTISAQGGNCNGLTFALFSNGVLKSTGINNVGQLGLGDYNNRSVFTSVSGIASSIKSMNAMNGAYTAMALIGQDGSLWGCGRNNTWFGYTTNPMDNLRFVRLDVGRPYQNKVLKIAFGYRGNTAGGNNASTYGVFILTTDGLVYAGGDNNSGQLAQGNQTASIAHVPVTLPVGKKAVDIMTAGTIAGTRVGNADNIPTITTLATERCFILMDDGTLWGAGYDGSDNALGTGSGGFVTTLTQVKL